MTMTRREAMLAAYRYGGRTFGRAPASVVSGQTTRPIRPEVAGQHRALNLPDPDAPVADSPRWRHAARPPRPLWPVAVAMVALVLLAVAVMW